MPRRLLGIILAALVVAAMPAEPAGASARKVALPDGRRLFLECRGKGSPTVVLEAGLRNRGDVWSTLAAPG
jgi:hypothetical protein